jgi:hypothetical protein
MAQPSTASEARKPEYSTPCQGVKNVSSDGMVLCAQPSRYRPATNQPLVATMAQSKAIEGSGRATPRARGRGRVAPRAAMLIAMRILSYAVRHLTL